MADRRYSEAEAAEIFKRAAELESNAPRALAATEGLSLAELQEIGREAGLQPDLVERAARDSSATGAVTTRRLLGLPLSVGHTIELERSLSDSDWARLVSDLRDTFEAKGVLRHDGPFRQWSNGNLHVLVEPTRVGHRVRFRTTNGSAMSMLTAGTMSLGISVILSALFVLSGRGEAVAGLTGIAFIGASGAVMAVLGALRLPAWARTRKHQMEELASRVAADSELPALSMGSGVDPGEGGGG